MGSGCAKPAVNEEEMFTGRRNQSETLVLGDFLTERARVITDELVQLRKPASWLVAVCERSENRGCGGGVVAERERNLAVPLC